MKKYVLGFIAIIMAITFSAFTLTKNKISEGAQKTFIYNNYPDDSFKDDPTHYSIYSGTLSCAGTLHRCGVKANDDGTGHPVMLGAIVLVKN